MAKESPRPKPKPKPESSSAFRKFEELAKKIVRVPKAQVRKR